MHQYVADFETTPDPDDCRVWLWCLVNIDDITDIKYGYNIKSFFDATMKGNNTIYFHNLKFDGQFLLWYAMHELNMEYSENLEAGTINTLINDSGTFYKIEMIYDRKGKKVEKTAFLDSYKKLPFKVKDIAIAFGLDVTKGEIDHKKPRPIGYKPDENELEYVTNDVLIVAKALKIQFEEGLTKMTMSSDGLNYCKNLITKTTWDTLFPVLSIEIDDQIRRSYKGGVVQVNPNIQGKEVFNGHSFDKNSMYPWAMLKTMPCGIPIFFTGRYKYDPEYPLYIQCINCEFKVKDGFIPTIQIKNSMSYAENKYITESVEKTTLYLTNVDLELFFEHYEVYDYDFICGWKFKAVNGVFDAYVYKWYNQKKTSKGAKRQIAKLMLNAFYGKTASRTHIKSKIPYLDEEGIVRYRTTEEQLKKPVYTAVASFITSYGRESVIRSAQSLGGTKPGSHFCYMDTDSVHVTNITVEECEKYIHVDPSELGAWKHEYSFKRAKYLRQKCYIEELESVNDASNPEYIKKCAGMTEGIKDVIQYGEFELGYTIDGMKLQPKNVRGGVILVPRPFSIKK